MKLEKLLQVKLLTFEQLKNIATHYEINDIYFEKICNDFSEQLNQDFFLALLSESLSKLTYSSFNLILEHNKCDFVVVKQVFSDPSKTAIHCEKYPKQLMQDAMTQFLSRNTSIRDQIIPFFPTFWGADIGLGRTDEAIFNSLLYEVNVNNLYKAKEWLNVYCKRKFGINLGGSVGVFQFQSLSASIQESVGKDFLINFVFSLPERFRAEKNKLLEKIVLDKESSQENIERVLSDDSANDHVLKLVVASKSSCVKNSHLQLLLN